MFRRDEIGNTFAVVRADEVEIGDTVAVSSPFVGDFAVVREIWDAITIGDDVEFWARTDVTSDVREWFTTSVGNAVMVRV